jgi:hypothetical protein
MTIGGYTALMKQQLKDYVLRIVANKEQGRGKLTDSEQNKLTAELYADPGLRDIIISNAGSWSGVSEQWANNTPHNPPASKIYQSIRKLVKQDDQKAKNAKHSKKRKLAIAGETGEQTTERKAGLERQAKMNNERDGIQKGDHASERSARRGHQAGVLNERDRIQKGDHASEISARVEHHAMSSCLLDSRALLEHHRALGWKPASARVTGALYGHTTTLPASHRASIKIGLNAIFARLKVAR